MIAWTPAFADDSCARAHSFNQCKRLRQCSKRLTARHGQSSHEKLGKQDLDTVPERLELANLAVVKILQTQAWTKVPQIPAPEADRADYMSIVPAAPPRQHHRTRYRNPIRPPTLP